MPNQDRTISGESVPIPIRVAYCPQCKAKVTVSEFNPLDRIQCGHCGQHFDLFRDFGNYRLLRCCTVTSQRIVYLGEHRNSKRLTMLAILPSQTERTEESVGMFFKEAEPFKNLDLVSLAENYQEGVFSGFQYFAVELNIGTSEEEVLEEVDEAPGDPLTDTQSISFDPPIIPFEREIPCPHCKVPTDVSTFDPLDRVVCPHCKQPFELLRQFGQYRIKSRLNEGGTSVLYIASRGPYQEDVALKVLSAAEIHSSREAHTRFIQESELTKQLKHPNLIQVFESGCYAGFHFMSMELVEGLTLEDIMQDILNRSVENSDAAQWQKTGSKRERFLPSVPELISLEILLQAAAGLGVAHQHKLVHGDIKPANIMITYQGKVKVLDFGLVQFANTEKLVGDSEEYSIYGTPLYIPPERVRGEREDFRSDFYGLGATLYHLLRGVAPFHAKTASEVAMMHAESPRLVFSAHAPWVSESTCRIVEKSMKKLVADRYSSHLELISDLTLAKNQILNRLTQKPKDGEAILASFMKSFPSQAEGGGIWKHTESTAIRSYRPHSSR